MRAEDANEEVSQPSLEETQTEETAPEEDQEQEFDVEEEARYGGWVPQEEFRGPKNTWLDAETFVRRGREINPILRANNDRLRQSLNAIEQQNRLYAEEIRALKEAQQGINQRDFETTLAIKNRQRMAAMKAGDEDLFLRMDTEIANLLLSKGELIEGRRPQNISDRSADNPADNVDPVFNQWVNENNWYGNDEFRTLAVNRIAEQMRENYPNLVGRAFLDAVLRNTAKRYPEDFGVSPYRGAGQAYASDRRSIGDISSPGAVLNHDTLGKLERDLPADARSAMENFVKEGLGKKEDYIRLYFEG